MVYTFKCLISGNTVSFEHDVDVKSMRKHPGYVEVTNTPTTPEAAPVKKTAGRPPKAQTTVEAE